MTHKEMAVAKTGDLRDGEMRQVSAGGMNRDRDMAALEELMRAGRMPKPALLRNGPVDFLKLLCDDGAGGTAGRGAAVVMT